jgi:hypothetical protein
MYKNVYPFQASNTIKKERPMGLFDKVFSKNTTDELNAPEAFAGIALCAVAADGVITEEEAISLSVNLMNRKLYNGYSDREMRTVFNKLITIINSEGVNNLMEKSAKALPEDLRQTAFAVTTDLLLADGVMANSEKKFLEQLQKNLQLTDEVALKIAEVISIKNKG